MDEAERSLHDALCVLTQTVKETRTVPGGGCTEIAMAAAIDAEVKLGSHQINFRDIFSFCLVSWYETELIRAKEF